MIKNPHYYKQANQPGGWHAEQVGTAPRGRCPGHPMPGLSWQPCCTCCPRCHSGESEAVADGLDVLFSLLSCCPGPCSPFPACLLRRSSPSITSLQDPPSFLPPTPAASLPTDTHKSFLPKREDRNGKQTQSQGSGRPLSCFLPPPRPALCFLPVVPGSCLPQLHYPSSWRKPCTPGAGWQPPPKLGSRKDSFNWAGRKSRGVARGLLCHTVAGRSLRTVLGES